MTSGSGNGVKVAEFIKKNRVSIEKIKKIKARNFIAQTGIKANRAEIEKILITEIDRQETIRSERRSRQRVDCVWYKDRILGLLEGKRYYQKRWDEMYAKAITLNDALERSYSAAWHNDETYVKLGASLLRITWDEDTDWEYYSKKYNRPKNTYSNRRVELLTFGGHAQIARIVDTYHVERFVGAFLVDAIAKFTGLQKVKAASGLQSVQLNPYFAVRLIRTLDKVKLYERRLAGELVDYCAIVKGTTYHANTKQKALDGLREKMQARAEIDTEVISYKTGIKLGFCSTGINQFVEDNGLDIDGSYTRAELRNVIIKQRALNTQKYRQELAKLGIRISE